MPGATILVGQQAHEREAEHDEHKAGDFVATAGVDVAAYRGCTRAERSEDDGEPDEERDAGDDDALRHTPLAEPLGFDRRDRREIAGNERQPHGVMTEITPARNAIGMRSATWPA